MMKKNKKIAGLDNKIVWNVLWLAFLTILLPVGASGEFPPWLWFLMGVTWGQRLGLMILSIRGIEY